jgi:hypothetical protein
MQKITETLRKPSAVKVLHRFVAMVIIHKISLKKTVNEKIVHARARARVFLRKLYLDM